MPLNYYDFNCHAYNQKIGCAYNNRSSTNQNPIIRPTDKELDLIAKDIRNLFNDGIEWRDIPLIMKLASHFLEDLTSMSLENKRDSILHILFYIIDNTDTPLLPDSFFDPLFKNIAVSFINILIPDLLGEYSTSIKLSGTPSSELIEEYAKNVFETFEDGFQWNDLVAVTRLAILFANQFVELDLEEKKNTAKSFVSYVIDNTDAAYLPDYFVDSIFKEVSNETIEISMDQLLIR